MNISRIASDSGSDISAIASFAFVAIVELICSVTLDDHSFTFYIARSASAVFLILAVSLVCDIARRGHRLRLGAGHE
jgi:hypothetical protein